MTSLNDAICPERGMGCKNVFHNIPLTIFNNFNYDRLFVETKNKGLKRQLSSKITEEWLNEIS